MLTIVIFIFVEKTEKFLNILYKSYEDYKMNVHDYCLMDNHYHLFAETVKENISLLNATYQ